MSKCAVVLFSGGLDSTTCLGMAKRDGFEPIALSFDYGQRHIVELDAARKVVEHYGVERHQIVSLGFYRDIGGSALTDDIAVPKSASVDDLGSDIPVTYVPARNLVFLSQAMAVAEAAGVSDVYIGVNALDYSGYPDCRPEFFEQMARTLHSGSKLGTEYGLHIEIETPVIDLSKAEIAELGVRLKAPLEHTWSCYGGDELPCGKCDSCVLRARGFAEAGITDPLLSRLGMA